MMFTASRSRFIRDGSWCIICLGDTVSYSIISIHRAIIIISCRVSHHTVSGPSRQADAAEDGLEGG